MRELGLVLACLLSSCLPLAKVARAAAWIGSILDAAEAGAKVYHQRHPSMEAEFALAKALQRARMAVVALQAADLAGDTDAVVKAKREAVASYAEVRRLLDESGASDAAPAVGGAETTAPAPEPFDLPSVEAVDRAL